MSKRNFWALVMMGGLMMGTASCKQEAKQQEAAISVVKLDTIHTAGEAQVLQFPGRIVAATEVHPAFKVAGTLKKVYVREGDKVRVGQLLAEMDDTDYRIQLSATEAEYTQIKADAERIIGLYNDGGTTASNYDKARYGLQQIEAKLKNHRNQLAYTKIYSTIDGSVQTRYFEGGETVGAGMPILSLLGGSDLEVEVNLPPASYMLWETFVSYTCSSDVLPGKEIELKPLSILPRANSNQLYTMRLRLGNQEEGLAAGMTVWVRITRSAGKDDEYIVPNTALLYEGEQVYVFIYDGKSHKVKRQPVEVVFINTDGEAKVKGLLPAGGLVVSSGVHHISDGVEVKPMEKTSKTNVGGLL